MSREQSTWSGLRWPIKAILIAAPIILVGYIGNKFGWFSTINNKIEERTASNNNYQPSGDNYQPGSDKSTSGTNSGGNNNNSNNNNTKAKGGDVSTSASDHRTFNFNPEKPVNGTLKGIVEVGATGFNSFVINVDKEKRWEIINKEFGKSFVYEGMATTEDIRAGLKKYISGIMDRGVQSRNVHFVISSGAQKEAKTAIISSELKKMGYVVNLVTPEQEGKLALKSVLPKSYENNSYVVDIGSGNTKISWVNGTGVTSIEAAGAKYYEKGMDDATVANEVKAKANSIPAAKREICFIIGGVPYELAKVTRLGEERFTVLNDPSTYSAGDKKKVACGLNIYKSLKEVTKCDTFVFDWDANFSIGFLLGLP
jgi:hypothetical protein